ncbi:S-adenosyl methyltransferase [Amycolatopsis arida]|uniref:S-adenosyl methyltransferase n=1 Tax=Amycolatopsis arida TaxID=587909 RepID=A0A1I5M1R3_9PSEU|nr:SAM-dependent methyltransferase [Amycolatopsis arida]TDX93936.1 S-adenosyl methyltransferase [Amycolatopsis arida]SFP03568.1 S-adenosyl methyltransferase [Amycolatopsis arida]
MTNGKETAPEAPPGVDLEKPSAARVYDWYLGGTHNWAVDREFGRRIMQLWPHAKHGSRHNRQFMNRVVRAAVDAGIRQFLDLGSGVPTVGNVHEVVRERLPEGERGRVVYVDYEEVAAAHARLILEREGATDWAALVQHDMRDPAGILRHPETRRLLDLDEPVCVLMIAVLHFVGPDDGPNELVRAYVDKLAPGSWLGLSHMTTPDDPELAAGVLRFADQYRNTANPVWLRPRDEIAGFFAGLTLLEPGITHLTDWRPDVDPARLPPAEAQARPFAWCGVAEKPD